MTDHPADRAIRQAIAGDEGAIAWIVAQAAIADTPIVLAMAALLGGDASALDRAWPMATTARDRQLVAIARARLAGDRDLVDALAREHLVDHPDSYVVSWIASSSAGPGPAAAP